MFLLLSWCAHGSIPTSPKIKLSGEQPSKGYLSHWLDVYIALPWSWVTSSQCYYDGLCYLVLATNIYVEHCLRTGLSWESEGLGCHGNQKAWMGRQTMCLLPRLARRTNQLFGNSINKESCWVHHLWHKLSQAHGRFCVQDLMTRRRQLEVKVPLPWAQGGASSCGICRVTKKLFEEL